MRGTRALPFCSPLTRVRCVAGRRRHGFCFWREAPCRSERHNVGVVIVQEREKCGSGRGCERLRDRERLSGDAVDEDVGCFLHA